MKQPRPFQQERAVLRGTENQSARRDGQQGRHRGVGLQIAPKLHMRRLGFRGFDFEVAGGVGSNAQPRAQPIVRRRQHHGSRRMAPGNCDSRSVCGGALQRGDRDTHLREHEVRNVSRALVGKQVSRTGAPEDFIRREMSSVPPGFQVDLGIGVRYAHRGNAAQTDSLGGRQSMVSVEDRERIDLEQERVSPEA